MEWLFSRTFFYPHSPSGIPDLMIVGTARDGRSPIGSYAYTLGDFSAGKIAQTLETYLEKGGNPRFDLRDPARYPKARFSTFFPMNTQSAGLYWPRMGDVGGPDKSYAYAWRGLVGEDLPESGQPGYCTAYAVSAMQPAAGGTRITLLRGADYYRSRITDIDEKKGIVTCVLGAPGDVGEMAGRNRNLVASNEALTKFWRADVLGGDRSTSSYPFKLTGAAVSEADFAPEGALRLWEYGVGDSVRQNTFATLRRVQPDVFAVIADADIAVFLPAQSIAMSGDGKTWTPLAGERANGMFRFSLGPTGGKAVFLRVER